MGSPAYRRFAQHQIDQQRAQQLFAVQQQPGGAVMLQRQPIAMGAHGYAPQVFTQQHPGMVYSQTHPGITPEHFSQMTPYAQQQLYAQQQQMQFAAQAQQQGFFTAQGQPQLSPQQHQQMQQQIQVRSCNWACCSL